MNEPNPGAEGGWNAARVLGMIVGVLGMVGFGVCSLCGLVIGAGDPKYWSTVLVFTIPGIILTVLFFFLVRAVSRRARRKPPGAAGP
jgi:biotin transporter BioY